MRMNRHHLLEIILWPNGDGTFRKILNSRARLIELGIYDDWKLTITIQAREHSRLHSRNRPDDTKLKMSKAKISNTNAKGKRSEEAKRKMSEACKGRTPWNKGKIDYTVNRVNGIGWHQSDEAKLKISKAKKGCKHSDESKEKMSAAQKGNTSVKGLLWYTNGITSIRAKECPPGFTRGRIYKRKAAK